MPSPDVLNFERLLQPLEGDSTAGADIRGDASPSSLYYQIKDARSAARTAERQAAMGDADVRADWRPVLKYGELALAEKTKDLEISAYMIEALVRLHGFAGLRDGFRLARGLVEQFWDGLYPKPDEDGIDTRVAPLASLSGDDAEGVLIQPIASVPLTDGAGEGPFALVDYQQAVAIDQLTDEEARSRRTDEVGISRGKIAQAVNETPAEFYVELVDDLNACTEEFSGLCTALDERCAGRPPPSSNVRDVLGKCLDAVRDIARNKLPSLTDQMDGEAAPAASAGSAGPPGSIRTREDALQTLLRVADFFRRTEPHNPVSYALEQAVHWSRLSLPDLLTELIPDEGTRFALFKHVGIKSQESG
jgi:type VI secretion system protein ImpA